VQALADFVSSWEHLRVVRRHRAWFERAVEPMEDRVRRLRRDGPYPGASTFRAPFPSPDQPGAVARSDEGRLCPA
jgi:hypothetical protein